MAIDAYGLAKDVIALGKAIYDKVEEVKANRKQCRRLATRIQIILAPIPTDDTIKKLQGEKKQGVKLENSFTQLKTTLEACSKQIDKYCGNNGFMEVVKSGWDKDKFSDLRKELSDAMKTITFLLTLNLNVDRIFDSTLDDKDCADDLIRNQTKLEKRMIRKLNQVSQNTKETLAVASSSRDLIVSGFRKMQENSKRQYNAILASNKQDDLALIEERFFLPAFLIEVSEDTFLGKGSLGKVFKGYLSGEEVAIKVIKNVQGSKGKTENQKEFIREVMIMNDLQHPRIVRLFGASLDTDSHKGIIVMEYMQNGSVPDALKILAGKEFELIRSKIYHQISLDVAEALNFMHSVNSIHRDLRLHNILLDKDWRAKLTDFGLSKHLTETRTRPACTTLGKKVPLRWRAPEAIKSARYTKESDVYSYGLLLWSLWTRKVLPYLSIFRVTDENNSIKVTEFIEKLNNGERQNIPEAIPTMYASIITACWRTKPEHRPEISILTQRLRMAPNFSEPLPKKVFSSENEKLFKLGLNAEANNNSSEAIKYFTQGNIHGDPRAQYSLARIHYRQEGKTSNVVRLFEKSADREYSPAQYEMGQHYQNIENNLDLAKLYYERTQRNALQAIPKREDIKKLADSALKSLPKPTLDK